MSSDDRFVSDAGTRLLVAAACFVVVIAGLRAATAVVLPFLVAGFLAVVSVPLMRWLERHRVPRPLAILSTVLAAVGVIGLLGLVVGHSVTEYTLAAPRYQSRLQDLMDSVVTLLEDFGVPAEEWRALDLLPQDLFDMVGVVLGALTSFASNTFLVLLTAIFIMMEAAGFSAKLRLAFGADASFWQFEQMTQQVQKYLVIKTAISAGTGIVVGLWVGALGLDFALLWGLVAFILNFIPSLGSIIAAIPAVLLAVLQFGLARAGVIAVGYVGINIIFGNFMEPMFMGRRLGLSTLVVFVSLVFWGWVWGPIGMLFSVPLTMVIKIALENTKEFRWVAVMLDPNPSISSPPSQTGA
jgi:AI-2 transport protein TqsA